MSYLKTNDKTNIISKILTNTIMSFTYIFDYCCLIKKIIQFIILFHQKLIKKFFAKIRAKYKWQKL